MTFTATVIHQNLHNLWHCYFKVPIDVAQQFITPEGDRRVVCHINGKLSYQCALMPDGDGGYYILLNKANRTKIRAEHNDPISVTLEKDHSEYGLPMPEELAELFKLDDEGSRYFHSLTPGKQRNLLHWTGSVKSSDLRIERALAVVEHLKMMKGKLDFKILYDSIKKK